MIKEFVIDLFCGAGGTSEGILTSDTDSIVVACVNHDANAIRSHAKNHPEAIHYTEDVRNPKVVESLRLLVAKLRRKHPNCIITIWASLECTNFSKAKGGLSRNADSRTLAHSLYMYIEAINPDYVMIENVREFQDWGPLRIAEEKKTSTTISSSLKWDKATESYVYVPERTRLKEHYNEWVEKMCSYGYAFDKQLYNAADLGSIQSRTRYFATFSKYSLPVYWPERTHNKHGTGGLEKWNAVRDALELDNFGESIFTRKKPYVESTHKKIMDGLKKNISSTAETIFLTTYYSSGTNHHSIDKPSPCVTTKDRMSKVNFVYLNYSTPHYKKLSDPAGCVMGNDKHNLVTAHIVMNKSFGNVGVGIDRPSPCIIARQDKDPLYLIACVFGDVSVPVYECDDPTMVEIKKFIAEHGIADVYMRMFTIEELLLIQGFPVDYHLIGTQADKKKYIGNAVEVTTAKKIFEAHYRAIIELRTLDAVTLSGLISRPLILAA